MSQIKSYVAPSVSLAVLFATRGQGPQIGEVISPRALGWAPHPQFGEIPDFRVVAITADGQRVKDGVFKCAKCGKEEVVHSGDIFQKRLCREDKAAEQAAKDAANGGGFVAKMKAKNAAKDALLAELLAKVAAADQKIAELAAKAEAPKAEEAAPKAARKPKAAAATQA